MAEQRTRDVLDSILRDRILVLDGAMGTMVQRHGLTEADFRGQRFAAHPRDLKGDNDLLVLTRPDVISGIHHAYLEAGADIIETSTFNGTAIAQADYGLEAVVYEHQRRGRAPGVRRGRAWTARTPDRPRFVAGAIGPTNRTLSLSPDVNNPAFRAVTFEQVKDAYAEQARGLLDGGCDLLLVETIFDTLNAKAALVAIEEVFEARGARVPVMISVTITDRSGRTLSGQTVEAFWVSIAHARPFSVGINCALGAREMRPFLADLAARRRHARQLLPQRRPAERVRPVRRGAGRDGRARPRVRRGGPGRHRRRLLRDDPGSHPRHGGGGRRHPSPYGAPAGAARRGRRRAARATPASRCSRSGRTAISR